METTTTKIERVPDLPDHKRRMVVARRFAQWYIGDPSWAGAIISAYLDPEPTREHLVREMDGA